MKNLALVILFFSIGVQAGEGNRVNNGGAVVVCGKPVRSVEVLESYDLRRQGQALDLDATKKTWQEKLAAKLTQWKRVAPLRMDMYEKWAASFLNETEITYGAEIEKIKDYGPTFIPKGCSIVTAAYQRKQADVRPGYKRYGINGDLWSKMNEAQKAVLVLHELVYREGILMEHQSSELTRAFTTFLVSNPIDAEAYFQRAIRQSLAFPVEYNGAYFWGENLFYYSGAIKRLILASVSTAEVSFLGVTIKNASKDATRGWFEWNEDGSLRTSFVRLSNMQASLHLYPHSEKFPYELTYECNSVDGIEKNNCADVSFYEAQEGALEKSFYRTIVTAGLRTKEQSESIFYRSERGQIEFKVSSFRRLEIRDEIDFSMPEFNFCRGTFVNFTNPTSSWLILPGPGKIENIKSITSSCASDEWLQIVSTTAVWSKKNGAWVRQ